MAMLDFSPKSRWKSWLLSVLLGTWTFPHPCFCLPAPPCIYFYTHHLTGSSHRFPSSNTGVSRASSSSHWSYKLCSYPSWPSSSLISGWLHEAMSCLLPCTFRAPPPFPPAMKKHPCRKGFVSYRTLDKTLALCHRFWLQRCPRLGRSLRCT